MVDVLTDLSAAALTHAVEANFFSLLPLWREWPAAEIHDNPGLLWSLTGSPFPIFNSIMRADLAPDEADAAIAAAAERGWARGVPILWWTSPESRPADLGARLVAGGFAHVEDAPGMAADLRELPGELPPPPGLVVEQVADPEALRVWCAAMCAGYEMPAAFGETYFDCLIHMSLEPRAPVPHYLGRLDREAVATATLFLAAGVAGVYDVATVPAARRKGIGAVMTMRPLQDALAEGYRAGILHSSAAGLPLYRRLGFREYCSIGQYLWKNEEGDRC